MAVKLWHVLFVGIGLLAAIVGARYVATPVPVAQPAPITPRSAPAPVDPNAASNAAQALLAAAVAPIEAYSADHDGYDGMTPQELRVYDRGVPPNLVVRSASAETYCIEATVEGQTFKRAGPSAAVATGPC